LILEQFRVSYNFASLASKSPPPTDNSLKKEEQEEKESRHGKHRKIFYLMLFDSQGVVIGNFTQAFG
jgi:hypothetical protein